MSENAAEVPPAPTQQQLEEEERIEALVAARVEQRLAAQLRDFGKVVLASKRADCSVLEAAASMGRHELLREMLAVFQTSSDGIAPPDIRSDLCAATLAAASDGRPQCLQLLLDSSPSSLTELLDTRDTTGHHTPLMKSARRGHVECMRLLLAHSPETQVAAKDECGWTALMHAAIEGHTSCIQLLLAHSPDIQVAAVDRVRWTALTYAVLKGRTACVALLLDHSPDVQLAAAGADGLNTLMLAALNGRLACMQLLLARSPAAQTAALSAGGWSALGFAVVHAHADCLRLLLAHSPSQQQLDRALGEAGQVLSQPRYPPTAAQEPRLRLRSCIELLLSNGAMLPAEASEGVIAAIRPISKDLAARALVPGMANEAVLGLALAATGRQRPHASGEDAAGASHPARTRP